MSTFSRWTKNPISGDWEHALWIDDHFGHHNYGIRFTSGMTLDPRLHDLQSSSWPDECGSEEWKPLDEFYKKDLDEKLEKHYTAYFSTSEALKASPRAVWLRRIALVVLGALLLAAYQRFSYNGCYDAMYNILFLKK